MIIKATNISKKYGDDVIFDGRIIGMPGGAGNAFSLLPPQNLSGNWIKIVQRLPVRVSLDKEQLKEHPLRIGLSTEATTDTREQEGLIVPVSTAGSPLYETPIFKKEEIGDKAFIQQIIESNMDPLLQEYLYTPFSQHTLESHDIPAF